MVALLAEGVDRNIDWKSGRSSRRTSLSSRRAWIEIIVSYTAHTNHKSLSSRRAWIEIYLAVLLLLFRLRRSPRGGRG